MKKKSAAAADDGVMEEMAAVGSMAVGSGMFAVVGQRAGQGLSAELLGTVTGTSQQGGHSLLLLAEAATAAAAAAPEG